MRFGSIWFGFEKSIKKSDPIRAVFAKYHPNTSNNIPFCAVYDFFDRFAVLILIGLDFPTIGGGGLGDPGFGPSLI